MKLVNIAQQIMKTNDTERSECFYCAVFVDFDRAGAGTNDTLCKRLA